MTSTEELPQELHRCGMGPMCRSCTVVDGKRKAAQIDKAAGLCDGCTRNLSRIARTLPNDWCKLELTLGEHRSERQEQTRKPKPGSRVPINVTTDALMRDMQGTLNEAADVVAKQMNVVRGMDRRDPSAVRAAYRRVTKAVALVEPNVDRLLADPEGLPLAKRLLTLHKAAVRHLGETAQRERLHLPCPVCRAQGLVKEVQDRRGREYHSDDVATPEVIRCTQCDGEWTDAEYQWLTTMVTANTEETEVELARYLLAEAHWQRDVHAWLQAETSWLLDAAAGVAGLEPAAMRDVLRERIGRVKA